MFIPAYLYKRITFTGADLAAPRAALQRVGFNCDFVETDEEATVEANADLVIAAIRARAQSGRRLILVSASKSGPEVALALTRLGPAETRHVAAWINTVGALQGSPMADERLAPELEYIVGKVNLGGQRKYDDGTQPAAFQFISRPRTCARDQLFWHSCEGERFLFSPQRLFSLAKYGPNDGVLLLSDMIFPGGITLAELGSDHFLLSDHLDITTVALAITVIGWLENQEQQISVRPGS